MRTNKTSSVICENAQSCFYSKMMGSKISEGEIYACAKTLEQTMIGER